MLQAGKPDQDVLLYWPIHDLFTSNKSFQFTVHDHAWLTSQPVGKAAQELWDGGYGFDYVSDRLLAGMKAEAGGVVGPGGNRWQVVLVPETRQMPLETFQSLLELANQGATVLFVGQVPQDVPGLANLAERRLALKKSVSSLPFQSGDRDGVRIAKTGAGRVMAGPLAGVLAAAGVRAEPMMGIPGMKFIRRARPDGKDHFVVNHAVTPFDGWLPLANPAESVLAMNPMTGTVGSLPLRASESGGIEVNLRLEPGHSIVLRSFGKPISVAAPYPQSRPGKEILAVSTPWNVRFLSGGPDLPDAYETPKPGPWTGRGDPRSDAFSGTASYRTTFDLPPATPRSDEEVFQIDLGEVNQIARLRLNGRDLGAMIMPPFRVDLPAGLLKPSGNLLEVEVTNPGANRLRDLDKRKVPWRIFHDINFVSITYKPMDTSKWPVQTSGLLGPVRLLRMD